MTLKMSPTAAGLNPMLFPTGDSHSTGPAILAVSWVFTAISAIVVGLKIWTRVKIIRETGLDDILTVIALAFLLAFSAMITVSVHRGLGQHVYYLTSEARNSAISLAIISNPLGFLASAWPNISVAISLNRILIPLPWQVAILYGIPILQCTVALVCSILTYIQCTPLAGRWDPTLPHKCLPGNAILGLIYFNGALSAFTHIFLAIVPVFALWNIQMKLKTKVGVCLLMGTTAIAAVAAIIRTAHIHDPKLLLDFTYAIHTLLYWAVIEAAFIIIASCIPSLRPFVRVLGQSLQLEKAKNFLIPKGYHHCHSRRNRPLSLVPRASGSGATALPSPRGKHERRDDLESGTAKQEQGQDSAGTTPPSTGMTEKSMQREAEQAASQV